MRDLTRAHHFSIGEDPVRQYGVAIAGPCTLASRLQSDQELRGLRRLVCGALVAENDILEIQRKPS